MIKMHDDLSISMLSCLQIVWAKSFSSASSLRVLFQHADKSRELIACNIMIFYLFQRRNSL
jgi:hypothetical protein